MYRGSVTGLESQCQHGTLLLDAPEKLLPRLVQLLRPPQSLPHSPCCGCTPSREATPLSLACAILDLSCSDWSARQPLTAACGDPGPQQIILGPRHGRLLGHHPACRASQDALCLVGGGLCILRLRSSCRPSPPSFLLCAHRLPRGFCSCCCPSCVYDIKLCVRNAERLPGVI